MPLWKREITETNRKKHLEEIDKLQVKKGETFKTPY